MAVVAVALQFDPSLRHRINLVMQALPTSPEWLQLRASGLTPNNPFQTDKSNPDAWVQSLANDPEKSATFPDWARDYAAYKVHQYNMIHFYDLDFADGGTRFVQTPNALTALPDLAQAVKNGSAGSKAWALAWILHIVGDLHQPLHTTSREMAGKPGQGDGGGNGVHYGNTNLHGFWDHLPDSSVGSSPDAYAQGLYQVFQRLAPADRNAILQRAQDLNPIDWASEGRNEIVTIGYPSDQKVPNYPVAALQVANRRILLGGARLAVLLNQLLPPG